jgi:hypothetical protein
MTMNVPPDDVLPDETEGGVHGTWKVTDRNGTTAEFDADFLGFGSSFRPSHNHVFPPHAPKRAHCSTCRWSETWIFQEGRNDPSGRFVVISYGRSGVPGEVTFVTFGYADTVRELIKVLTLQPSGQYMVTPPVSRALTMAGDYSDGIHDVLGSVIP